MNRWLDLMEPLPVMTIKFGKYQPILCQLWSPKKCQQLKQIQSGLNAFNM